MNREKRRRRKRRRKRINKTQRIERKRWAGSVKGNIGLLQAGSCPLFLILGLILPSDPGTCA
ncbi:hypothetical protein EYF80_042609 [Liparis tanakae]|uniref:Uncharacterized protein n=1 Tax=Liparis tanakae TaxID=230148 RepID=A0A4Z2G2U8_9TELE|nr:hypothetical protein EYF80_042609 [Liparis tanakae]